MWRTPLTRDSTIFVSAVRPQNSSSAEVSFRYALGEIPVT